MDNRVKNYSIGEVSSILGVKESTLRYWEKEFDILNPDRTNSNRRVYNENDIKLIKQIMYLLNDMKYTIAGAKEELEKAKIIYHDSKEKVSRDNMNNKKVKYTKIKNELEDILNILNEGNSD
jgi:DNA-binding transcriptional MerR regulator